ncbi:hypothetical protein AYI68_g4596 [Smittium mucronatum]|uniref:Uncharacterized protein n=1 Tax=Smittium mucronatum TaxID=133383 RepID=A0A1R0GWM6_9FUNG|nr:hypothetical protein AYI68_g4596 [Smittium mucronatum]
MKVFGTLFLAGIAAVVYSQIELQHSLDRPNMISDVEMVEQTAIGPIIVNGEVTMEEDDSFVDISDDGVEMGNEMEQDEENITVENNKVQNTEVPVEVGKREAVENLESSSGTERNHSLNSIPKHNPGSGTKNGPLPESGADSGINPTPKSNSTHSKSTHSEGGNSTYSNKTSSSEGKYKVGKTMSKSWSSYNKPIVALALLAPIFCGFIIV